MKLSKRQKMVAGFRVPEYGGFATRKEITETRKQARGHWWLDVGDIDPIWREYIAYSPTGRKMYFYFGTMRAKKARTTAMRAAKYWSQGNYKEAWKVYYS
jgi:hypothetical protein